MSSCKGKSIEKYKKYFEQNRKKIIEDFFAYLRFPSISADPAHKKDMESCSKWVAAFFQKASFSTEVWQTPGNPVVFAHHQAKKPGRPTILFYHHYDVQPVDPLELWKTPPFEPTLVGKEVYARGAQDNKGQCLYSMYALKAFLEISAKDDLNIKVLIDGEEEIGSEGLFHVLEEKHQQLSADYTVIVDVGIPSLKQPAVTLGCRGIITMDVECRGSHVDLHSGSLGGVAYNPLRGLVEVLAKVRDEHGAIAIDHFYDGIEKIDSDLLMKVCLKDTLEKFDLKALHQEKGYTLLESNWMRPTFEINGMAGGYAGPGFKTVIPATASCKISCRLVAGQDPEKVGRAVERFLKKHIAKGLDLKIELGHGGRAYVAPAKSLLARKLQIAYEEVLGVKAGFALSGGTLPICSRLAEVSGGDTICMGYGLDDDYIHAPNEHFGIDRLEYGFTTVGVVVDLLAGE